LTSKLNPDLIKDKTQITAFNNLKKKLLCPDVIQNQKRKIRILNSTEYEKQQKAKDQISCEMAERVILELAK
jgi:hypothetical protein